MDILGHDTNLGGYKVAIEHKGKRLLGLVSDALLADEFKAAGDVVESMANEWLTTNRYEVENALKKHDDGGSVRSPYDRIVLLRDK